MCLIKAAGLKKTYRMGEVDVNALDDINLEINEGELVVILGPSGSGKSTLLNILGGMDLPTEGEVWYKDKKLSSMGDEELTYYRRDNIGFVFQFYNLMSGLTAYENVELAAEISKNPLNLKEVVDEVGLTDRMRHFPAQLSGGEQQRVAIARAVAKNPDILLCDEPTGALDYKTGIEVLKVLVKVHRLYNKTIIVITHNAAIAQIAQRIIKLGSGKVIEDNINENPLPVERITW